MVWGEIDCHSNVVGWVRSSDDAVIVHRRWELTTLDSELQDEIPPTYPRLCPIHEQIHWEPAYRPLQFQKLNQLFKRAHDDPLSAAMRVFLALSVVVENGYD